MSENLFSELDDFDLSVFVQELLKAGLEDELHYQLSLETSDRHNAWYQIRDIRGAVDSYVADIRQAWRSVETAYDSTDQERVGYWIGLQCRYALICASLISHVARVPSEIIVQSVKYGVWSPTQALSYALQTPASAQRVKLLAAILPYFPEEYRTLVLEEAVASARKIDSRVDRVRHLALLVEFLPTSLQIEVTSEMLREAQLVERVVDRATALQQVVVALKGDVPEELIDAAVESIRRIPDVVERVTHVSELIPYLPESHRTPILSRALEQTLEISDEGTRARLLGNLVPLLSESLWNELLEGMCRTTWDYSSVIEVLVALAGRVPTALLPRIFSVARSIRWEQSRAEALVKLVPFLSEELRDEVVAEALQFETGIDDEKVRMEIIGKLAPLMAQVGYMDEAVVVAQSIPIARYRLDALSSLVGDVSDSLRSTLVQEALAMLESSPRLNKEDQPWILTRMVLYLPLDWIRRAIQITLHWRNTDMRDVLLLPMFCRLADLGCPDEALELARATKDAWYRAVALEKLASHIPISLRDQVLWEALAIAEEIEDESDKVRMIGLVLERLPESLKSEALRKVSGIWKIGDYDERALALARLYSGLPVQYKAPATEAVNRIESSEVKLDADLALSGCWPLPVYTKRPKQCKGAEPQSYSFRPEPSVGCLLSIVGAKAPSFFWYVLGITLLFLVMRAGNQVGHGPRGFLRITVSLGLVIWLFLSFTRLISLLPGFLRKPLLRFVIVPATEALASRSQIHKYSRAPKWLFFYFGGYTDWRILGILAGTLHKFWALAWLAPRLPEPLLRNALAGIWKLPDEGTWSSKRGLAALAPYLSEALFAEVLGALREAEFSHLTINILPVLAPYLSNKLLGGALSMLRAEQVTWKSDNLDVLLSRFQKPGNYDEAQAAVATRLAELGRFDDALALAQDIVLPHQRVRAWTGLVPPLLALPKDTLVAYWCDVSHFLADQERKHMLVDLCALSPVIKALGGIDARVGAFRAVEDVGHWWP